MVVVGIEVRRVEVINMITLNESILAQNVGEECGILIFYHKMYSCIGGGGGGGPQARDCCCCSVSGNFCFDTFSYKCWISVVHKGM